MVATLGSRTSPPFIIISWCNPLLWTGDVEVHWNVFD
jgi:hypothetical protein